MGICRDCNINFAACEDCGTHRAARYGGREPVCPECGETNTTYHQDG
jgi:hypothetical protein